MRKFSAMILALLVSGCALVGVATNVSTALDSFFDRYSSTIKRLDPKLRYLGPTILSGDTITNFGAHVMYQGELDLSQGRELFVNVLEDFLSEVNHSTILKKYLDPYPLTADRVEYILSFWDHEMDRPQKPNLAEIRMRDNMVEFFYKQDTSEGLELVGIRESYPQTKKLALKMHKNK